MREKLFYSPADGLLYQNWRIQICRQRWEKTDSIRAYLVTERAAAGGGDVVLHVSDVRSASWDGSSDVFANRNGADRFRLGFSK